MKRLRLALSTASICALIATAVPIQAATTFAPYSVALSPQENRQIQAQNAALARALGLTVNLVDAVARELGLKTPKSQFSYGRFLSDIRTQAGKAKELRAQIVTLRSEVDQLKDAALRPQAVLALQTAQRAFDEGRLADAEAALGKLAFLRKAQSVEGLTLWKQAVKAQANMAALQLDEDRATQLLDEALAFQKQLTRVSRLSEWELANQSAIFQLSKGERLGNIAVLAEAVRRYRDEVLPRAPKDEFPQEWATTLNNLGYALQRQGESVGEQQGIDLLAQAANAYTKGLIYLSNPLTRVI